MTEEGQHKYQVIAGGHCTLSGTLADKKPSTKRARARNPPHFGTTSDTTTRDEPRALTRCRVNWPWPLANSNTLRVLNNGWSTAPAATSVPTRYASRPPGSRAAGCDWNGDHKKNQKCRPVLGDGAVQSHDVVEGTDQVIRLYECMCGQHHIALIACTHQHLRCSLAVAPCQQPRPLQQLLAKARADCGRIEYGVGVRDKLQIIEERQEDVVSRAGEGKYALQEQFRHNNIWRLPELPLSANSSTEGYWRAWGPSTSTPVMGQPHQTRQRF